MQIDLENRVDVLDEYTIFLGGQCNSNCTMCPSTDYERSKVNAIQEEDVFNYINELPEYVEYYTVTGGEPTLNRDLFIKTMAIMAEKYPMAGAQLLTNGRTFASMSFLNLLLEKCPPDLVVAIPIHGSTSDIHDSITRASGSFEQTIQGIKNLLAKRIAVEIRIVVNKQNMDDIENIARLIRDMFPEAYRVNFISLEYRGNCYTNGDKVYISPHDSFLASKKGIDLLVSNGIDVGLYNYPLCNVSQAYWTLCKKSISLNKVRYDACCDKCRAKDICGGLFATTLKLGKPQLNPIGENND